MENGEIWRQLAGTPGAWMLWPCLYKVKIDLAGSDAVLRKAFGRIGMHWLGNDLGLLSRILFF